MNDKVAKTLAIRFFAHDIGNGTEVTVRQYLGHLLMTLWRDQEGFSGKRPFGNSGWDYDLAIPLIEAGMVEGTIEEGYVGDINDRQFNELIELCIQRMSA